MVRRYTNEDLGKAPYSSVELGGATLYGTRGEISPEDIRSSLKLLGKTRVAPRPAPGPAGAAPVPGGGEFGGYGWAQGVGARNYSNYLAAVTKKDSIRKFGISRGWSNARTEQEYKKEGVHLTGTKKDPYDPSNIPGAILKKGKPAPYKIGTMKEFKEGGKIVTKKYTPQGKWEKTGEAPRWEAKTKVEYTPKTAHTRLSAISTSIAKLQKANTTSALDVLLSFNNPGYVPPTDGGGYEAAKSAAIQQLKEEAEYVSSYLPKDESPWPSPMGLPDWRAAFRGDPPPATRRPEELSDEELMAMINGS